jgi:hypothetical protein
MSACEIDKRPILTPTWLVKQYRTTCSTEENSPGTSHLDPPNPAVGQLIRVTDHYYGSNYRSFDELALLTNDEIESLFPLTSM